MANHKARPRDHISALSKLARSPGPVDVSVPAATWERLRKLCEIPHEHGAGMNECAICDEPLIDAAIQKIEKAEALLREGATGFGRVLVATSDQKAVYDWLNRCRAFLGIKRKLQP